MRLRPRLTLTLFAATVAAATMICLAATAPSQAATAARSCSTVTLNAGHYGGLQSVRVAKLGRVSCREALHLARVYYGRLAANRCGRLNNFCNLRLSGGWSCSVFFAAESKEAGGASAG